MLATRLNVVRVCLNLCPYPSLLTSSPPTEPLARQISRLFRTSWLALSTQFFTTYDVPVVFVRHVPRAIRSACVVVRNHKSTYFPSIHTKSRLRQSYALLSERILLKGPPFILFFSAFGDRLLSVYVSRSDESESFWHFIEDKELVAFAPVFTPHTITHRRTYIHKPFRL